MARYAKVYGRIWNDARFRSLTVPGKLVFLFALTHPSLTMLGAMRASEAGLGAELDMDAKGFGEAFQEVLSKGLAKYDSRASCLWLPNFLRYNKPESPNVIKAWPNAFDLIPECQLKGEIFQQLKDFHKGLSQGFLEAFAEAFPEDYAKPVTVTVAVYPIAESSASAGRPGYALVEPEELKLSSPKADKVRRVKSKPETTPDPRHSQAWQVICESYRQKNGVNCPDAPRCNKALKQFLSGCDWSIDDIAVAIRNRFDSDKPPASEAPYSWLPRLATWRNGPIDAYGKLKATTSKAASRRYANGTAVSTTSGGANVVSA